MIEINAAFQDNCTDLGLLGRADEGRTRSIVFDCKDILGEYPDAKMIAVITQPCTGKKYSASLSERGTDRILVIERSDTAYPGIINIELRAIIDDDGNKRKSAFYKGKIEASMIGEGDAPGAPVRDMLDRAEERLERLSNIRAEAETLKPDEDATASYDNDNAILKLGIPQGKDGGNVDQDPTDEYCGIVNSRNDSVIDQTLTMAGQAADAKACGERLSEKQDVLTDSDRQSIVRIGIVGGAEWTADEQRAARERMGLPGDYELIEEVTISEAVTSFIRELTPDGTPYSLAGFFCVITSPGVDNAIVLNQQIWAGETSLYNYGVRAVEAAVNAKSVLFACVNNKILHGEQYPVGALHEFANVVRLAKKFVPDGSPITKIVFGGNIPANTKITIYGVRA